MKIKKILSRKAQAWGFDLMIASIIFIAGIIIFYVYSLNYPAEGKDILDKLIYEGNVIADSLLSDGFPTNWNSNNVIRIGILTDNKVNQTKLENLYNMTVSANGYQKTRVLFNTKYQYFFNFSEQITLPSYGNIAGIGNSFVGQDTKSIIKITRVTVYNDKPTALNIYIWEY